MVADLENGCELLSHRCVKGFVKILEMASFRLAVLYVVSVRPGMRPSRGVNPGQVRNSREHSLRVETRKRAYSADRPGVKPSLSLEELDIPEMFLGEGPQLVSPLSLAASTYPNITREKQPRRSCPAY